MRELLRNCSMLKKSPFLFRSFFFFFCIPSSYDRLTCSCKFRIIRFSQKIEFSSKLRTVSKKKKEHCFICSKKQNEKMIIL